MRVGDFKETEYNNNNNINSCPGSRHIQIKVFNVGFAETLWHLCSSNVSKAFIHFQRIRRKHEQGNASSWSRWLIVFTINCFIERRLCGCSACFLAWQEPVISFIFVLVLANLRKYRVNIVNIINICGFNRTVLDSTVLLVIF